MEGLSMKMEIKALLDFVGDPQYREDAELSWQQRFRKTVMLLPWALGVALLLALLIGGLDALGPWKLDEHAIELLLETYPTSYIFILATLVAPIIEEFLFRGPLLFFRDSRFFKAAFWGLTILFALVHLGNFPGLSDHWFLAPLLISPPFSLGIFLGFIRVRFGLLYAILFHAGYNAILIGPALFLFPAG